MSCVPRGRCSPERLKRLLDIATHAAEIAALRAGVNVNHRLHVVMRDDGGPLHRRQLHQVAQQLRIGHVRIRDRSVHQVLQRGHAILRRLHSNLIAHAVRRIQPEIRRGLKTAAQRNQHALRDVLRRHAHLGHPVAFNVQMERRQVQHLLHVYIGGTGNVLAAGWKSAVPSCSCSAISATHQLYIDGRGQAEIQDLRNDVSRLEEELHAGKPTRQTFAQSADVLRRGMMMLLIQAQQDLRVAGADHAGVAVGQIDTGIRQPDVVEYRDQLAFGYLLPEIVLNFVAKPRGLLDAHSGTPAQVKAHQTGIDAGKEILAQQKHQDHGSRTEREEAGGEDFAMLQRSFQQLIVAITELIEATLKPALIAPENRLRPSRAMFVAAHDVHHQRRNQGSREEIGRQHGEALPLRPAARTKNAPRR